MDFTALDQKITALQTHLTTCSGEIIERRVSSSITDDYKRALRHEQEHLTQLIEALGEVRALAVTLDSSKITQAQGDARYALAGQGGLTLADVYRVGCIYTSTISTNPGVLFGFGVWAAFGTGRVLVGVDVLQTEFDAVEKTGGAKTHTLTAAEMPSHTHTQDAHTHVQNAHTHAQDAHTHTYRSQSATTGAETTYEHGVVDTSSTGAAEGGVTVAATAVNQNATAVNQNATATNQNTGGGGAHNNLQPFVTTYFWKRTA